MRNALRTVQVAFIFWNFTFVCCALNGYVSSAIKINEITSSHFLFCSLFQFGFFSAIAFWISRSTLKEDLTMSSSHSAL